MFAATLGATAKCPLGSKLLRSAIHSVYGNAGFTVIAMPASGGAADLETPANRSVFAYRSF